MDKIILKGLEFSGKHGCFPEEKINSQNFIIDGKIYLNLEEALKSDELDLSVNYGEVFEIIKNQVENNSYDLIEKLAGEIIKDIFNYSKLIKEIKIVLKKPRPPVDGKYKYFAVEIRRKREWLKHI